MPAGRRSALEAARTVQRIVFDVCRLCRIFLHKVGLLEVLDLACDWRAGGSMSPALKG